MSAFQVSSAHIARIIGIADALQCGSPTRAPSPYVDLLGMEVGYTDITPRVFDLLARANADSVNFRYMHEPERCEPVPFVAIPRVSLDTLADVVAAIKVLDCYDYQSCEVPDWRTSAVCQWIERVRAALFRAIPGYLAAYNAAPWSIT